MALPPAPPKLETASFMDYLMPTAVEVPAVEVLHLVSPSPFTPLGIKGMGEGGRVSPGAVLAGAIADALRPVGVRLTRGAREGPRGGSGGARAGLTGPGGGT